MQVKWTDVFAHRRRRLWECWHEMSRSALMLLAALAAVGCLLLVTAGAGAVVPPRDCGRMTLKRHHYQVKVDQITCAAGRGFVRGYVNHHTKPHGYTCHNYPVHKGRVRFYCSSGIRVFFGILR